MKKTQLWIWPMLVAALLFFNDLAGNLIAEDFKPFFENNRSLVYAIVALAFVAAIILAVRESRQAPAEQPNRRALADEFTEQRTRYLRRIVSDLRHIPLSVIDRKSANAETAADNQMGIADVYIALNTTASVALTDAEKEALEGENRVTGDHRPLPALDALIKAQQMVLLGDPGGGKSTFVNHLALCIANDALEPRADWLDRLPEWPEEWQALTPIPIVLREVAAWLQRDWPTQRRTGLFKLYLQEWLARLGIEEVYESLEQDLKNGHALLLIDGLDEVPLTDDILERIKEMIDDLPQAFAQTPMVVTCRVLSYQDARWKLGGQWTSYNLAALDAEQIDSFIHSWHAQLAAAGQIRDIEVRDKKLRDAVRGPALNELASNPMLLTVMAIVHTSDGQLPDARVQLYDRVVDLLLWRWETAKISDLDTEQAGWHTLLGEVGLKRIDIEKVLWQLAYEVHGQQPRQLAQDDQESTSPTADIAESALLNALRQLDPDGSLDWAEKLVQQMKLRAGLLVERLPGIYGLPHRTFQEYLAARHIDAMRMADHEIVKLTEQGSFWREVILLYVSHVVHQGYQPPLTLVGELCGNGLVPEADDELGWRNAWLAGLSLIEIGLEPVKRSAIGPDLLAKNQKQLTALITQDCLQPRERSEAGSVLSQLGDDRGFDEMVPVPAGKFLMGSTDEDELALDSEKTQHEVDVADFRIGKYLVTNAQYEIFVKETDAELPHHWHEKTAPSALCNHPVVYVSWHDAQAYCRWLSQKRGEEVRLPTEAEWEKAARGTDGRFWPWGNEFSSSCCNVNETGVGSTSPVGIFAAGVSSYGTCDMAGNVWEWTGSLWGKEIGTLEFGYPYDATDGRENLQAADDIWCVVRGGSFLYDGRYVRCAYRHYSLPLGRVDSFGFRVVSPGL